MLCTKSDAQVRTFFVNYRRKYNLDSVLKEFEQEAALKLKQQQQQQQQQQRQKASSTVVGATETAAVGEALSEDANKDGKSESANGVNGENQNLSMDDDVMEVRECQGLEKMSVSLIRMWFRSVFVIILSV
jgi:hypothetical protein